MGGEESEKEEDLQAILLPSLVGVKLVDAPILFFVFSHKAFRKELEELHRIVLEAADSFKGSFDGQFVDDLRRRMEFFKFVFKYHSAAEDELIFMALDTRVKNVVSTYALEHKSIDDDFDSVFGCLDLLRQESEEISSLFQKLIISIGTIKRIICQHMLKEEKQVFRLLIQQFSPEEQAKLLWQYMCSVPVVVQEDFLPWMACSLPLDEQIDLLQCMKVVIPKEELLQEVVISWLENKKQSSFGHCNTYGKGAQFYGGEISFKEILDMCPGNFHFGEEQEPKKTYSTCRISRQNPFDSIHIWNTSIRSGFRKVLDEIYEISSSNNLSNLSSVVILLQFLLDVLICYR